MIHVKKKCSRLNVRSLQPVLFNKPKANTAAEPQDFMWESVLNQKVYNPAVHDEKEDENMWVQS